MHIDVIARFQRPMVELLLDFGDEVLDAVKEHKGVDVDDIRDRVLGPLRAYARHLESPHPDPRADPRNTSTTSPRRGATGE